MNVKTPRPIGPYKPNTLISGGGQATIWRADGPDGVVALKIARTLENRTSLEREAHWLRKLNHPNIVKLIEADSDHAWLALEFFSGAPMDQWAEIQSLDAVIDAFDVLTSALAYLHGQNLVHGDLKPGNVLVSADGQIKVLDLGLACIAGEGPQGFRGTLGYAAPEQLRGDPPTPSSDYYGLGVLMYTCIAGRPPFVAADPAALAYLPLVSLPHPPASFRPETPALLNQLVLALLAREQRQRPTSPDKVRQTLAKAKGSAPAAPVFGMLEQREVLRRGVVGAADGEARVIVVYGPPGSGRRTLIGEAVGYALREGLCYLRGKDGTAALTAKERSRQPFIVILRASNKQAVSMAKSMFAEALPGLVLIHADHPLPSLVSTPAIQITPAPLRDSDVERLAIALGADPASAKTWRKKSMGLPAAILAQIRADQRDKDGGEVDRDAIPIESVRVLDALTKSGGELEVVKLASLLQMGEHTLLDHCEVLFAERLLTTDVDGLALRLTT